MSSRSSIPRRRNQSESAGSGVESRPSQLASSKRPRLSPAHEAETSDDEARSETARAPERSDEDESSNDETERGDAADEPSSDEAEENDAADGDEESMPPPPRQPLKAHAGFDLNGYKPGAIVRIKVTNFVTYNNAEFYPGPKLNMVIGPNGTGKSTLVCAICLGLGWGPQHLGRAKDLGEFVKHGCREATIEIELAKHSKGTRNPVISRTIKRDGNKSSFTLNGQAVSKTAVLKVAQEFAIQVDNLCQFLPQDKVAEFAALTPIELLHSTQRAAAGEEMVEQHDNLKTLRSEQKKIEIDNRGDKEELKNLENRQEAQRSDVERMRERAVIQQKIENMEFFRPVVEYKDWHRGFEELKLKKNRTEEEFEQLRLDLAPAMAAVNAKVTYKDKIADVKDAREKQVQQLSAFAQSRGKKMEDLDRELQDLNATIDAEKKSAQKHREEAGLVQQTINRLTREQENGAVEFNPDDYNQQLHEKRREIREVQEKASAIQASKRPMAERIVELKSLKQTEEQKLARLDSQLGQQESKLGSLSKDTYTAYQWLLENQDKFENEVFGPPIVTCSVTDPRYASAVESAFQRNDLTAFTTQSRKDFRTLQQALNRELNLWDISIKTITRSLDSMRPELSRENLQRLGFEGFTRDFLRGPDPVIAMLCYEKDLHRTPVSLTDISDEAYSELESGNITAWVAGKQSYNITRRKEYGPGAQTTRVRAINPARYWTSRPVDAAVKQQHRDNIQEWTAEQEQLENRMEEEKADLNELKDDMDRLNREMNDVEKEKAEKQTAYTHYRAIPDKLAAQMAKKAHITTLFEKMRERVTDTRNKQDLLANKKAKAGAEYADAVEKISEAYRELCKVCILHGEAKSELQILRLRHSEYAKMIEQKAVEARQIKAAYLESKEHGKTLMRTAKRLSNEIKERPGGEEIAEMMSPADYNIDHFNADMESARARLDLTQGGSANMIKEFEDRERKIERLRNKLSDFQAKMAELQRAINEVRSTWEPRLDALISRISDAFSDSFQRIGCAGQVCLDKVETETANGEPGSSEFDQWSIQIWVKFRENESLSLLNSHRQSGGERAVSTIFYLMALQSLSASPFRVVDEINQGMDPRNERMVHGRLVDIACAPNEELDEDGNVVGGGGGQYFLITPKLLSGLSYKRGMRVLCIYSGEHMPESGTVNFHKSIDTMKQIVARGGRTTDTARPPLLESRSQVNVQA
ncbi:hypothetical protein N7504_010293 [Penicillium tannophilum]|nr:hypothetical protein N7504_010293 [Penicillium tannophilum]